MGFSYEIAALYYRLGTYPLLWVLYLSYGSAGCNLLPEDLLSCLQLIVCSAMWIDMLHFVYYAYNF